jgi:hypothetical protein
LYFFLFGLIAALLGVWAMLQNDTTSIPAAIARTNWPTPPDPTKLQTCNDMNKFHALFSILYVYSSFLYPLLPYHSSPLHCLFVLNLILFCIYLVLQMFRSSGRDVRSGADVVEVQRLLLLDLHHRVRHWLYLYHAG